MWLKSKRGKNKTKHETKNNTEEKCAFDSKKVYKTDEAKNLCSVCIYCAIQGVSTQTLIQIH